MKLNKEQIERLYKEFDFDEDENIEEAFINQDHSITIIYSDEDFDDNTYLSAPIEEERIQFIKAGTRY